jgi:DNA polymerase I-like protein with 3'-5' exonuclease and polymerase domains
MSSKYSDAINTNTTIDEAIKFLTNFTTLALDTETTSVNVLNTDLLMLQLGTPDNNQFVFDMRNIPIERFKGLLEDRSRTFIGHNIKFDYNVLKARKMLLNKVYDTMVADQVIYNGLYDMSYIRKNRRFSLAGVYKHYFNETIDKETRQQFHKVHSEPFTEQQITYGALDVYYPLKIKDKQDELISKLDIQKCINLENKVVLVLGDIEYNGFHLNKTKWLQLNSEYELKATATERKLDELLLQQGKKWINKYKLEARQTDLFDSSFESNRLTTVNWGSDKQVYEILTKVFGIFPVDKHNKPSSGAGAIELLPSKHEITSLLLQLRKEEKAVNSFGASYLTKFQDPDGRIRTHYNQVIETGRISSRNPNLQQIPREVNFREAFEAPDGRMIITTDYSSQEARIMADRADDKSYIDFFLNGSGDVHSFVATKMFSAAFGKEFIVTPTNENKAYRQKGKTLNFAISFGASAFTISKNLKIPETEAQELVDSFFKGFPALKNMFDANKKFALENGYVRTNSITNRIRHFRYWKEYTELKNKKYLTREEKSILMKTQGKIERRAMNTPIQGTASDMTKLAIIYIREELLKLGIMPYDYNAPAKLVSAVHDETSIECVEERILEISELQKNCMEKAGNFFVKSVPMPALPVIKKHWDH